MTGQRANIERSPSIELDGDLHPVDTEAVKREDTYKRGLARTIIDSSSSADKASAISLIAGRAISSTWRIRAPEISDSNGRDGINAASPQAKAIRRAFDRQVEEFASERKAGCREERRKAARRLRSRNVKDEERNSKRGRTANVNTRGRGWLPNIRTPPIGWLPTAAAPASDPRTCDGDGLKRKRRRTTTRALMVESGGSNADDLCKC
ncbi:hypothetical protein DFH09DRAFT_1087192 [Mycena vulgaris]|nr:hypothetical protein DFH09DRAFT_1087192 [Mycena vulgaris]